MSTVKKMAADVSAAIERAFREGVEAGYLASLTQSPERMTFTHYRQTVANALWLKSNAKKDTL